MRTYKLQILQKKFHDDFASYVLDEIKKAEPDTVVVKAPKRKSVRALPRPGIKWLGGIITISNGNYRTFSNATFNNDYYFIKIVRKDKIKKR